MLPMASHPKGGAAAGLTNRGNHLGDKEAPCPACNALVRSYRSETGGIPGYCRLGDGGCGAHLYWNHVKGTWLRRGEKPPPAITGTCDHCGAPYARAKHLSVLPTLCTPCRAAFQPFKPCKCGNMWAHDHVQAFTCEGCGELGVGRLYKGAEQRRYHNQYCMNVAHRRRRKERRKANTAGRTPIRARSRVLKSRNLLAVGHRQKHKCAHCKRLVQYHDDTAPDAAHLDHIVPLAEGGPDTLANVQVLCARCNLTKGDRAPWDEQLRAV